MDAIFASRQGGRRNSKNRRKGSKRSSFHPRGRRYQRKKSSMEGLRLRSDSSGSMKSAFYQGTIVSATSGNHHVGATTTTSTSTNQPENVAPPRQRRTRRAGLDKKPLPTNNQESSTPFTAINSTHVGNSTFPLPSSYHDGRSTDQLVYSNPNTHLGYGPPLNRSKYVDPVTRTFAPIPRSQGGTLPETTKPMNHQTSSITATSEITMDDFGLESTRVSLTGVAPRDSLRYSEASLSSIGNQQLLGTSFLLDGPTDNGDDVAEPLQRTEPSAIDIGALSNPDSLSPTARFEKGKVGLSGRSGNSSSRDSGVYFHQPSPPGPLHMPAYPYQNSVPSQYPSYGTRMSDNFPKAMPFDSRIEEEDGDDGGDDESSVEWETPHTYSEGSMPQFDIDHPTWLTDGLQFDKDGAPYFDDNARWTVSGMVRLLLYNPVYPEFTSLQQFNWAVILGICMGIFTAAWKTLIEACVDFMWKVVPETLYEWGVFTDLDGNFPIYHYMWIVPGLFGGVLSYIFAALPNPIPGQNDWIHNLHSRGVQSSDTFLLLFILSTAGMASGLSLGPELPLILTSGMFGSWLGVVCKQSMLQARVLNLTAASAAIGGFFGFPMAGALFVLEVPHRMGLQYFEALSPATIASIVAVLTNRMVTGNDVTGYYEYPFLNESLPSHIFKEAILYGLFGGALGIVYTQVVLALKHYVHDLFRTDTSANHQQQQQQHHHQEDQREQHLGLNEEPMGMHERIPLMKRPVDFPPHQFSPPPPPPPQPQSSSSSSRSKGPGVFDFISADEPTRAAVSGTCVGIVVGVICIFVPHVMFWGEAQLQSLIDKGRTPLPVFGRGDEPSAGLVALGYCMIDGNAAASPSSGFNLGCSAAITIAKIVVTGLSLGTGIVGGHFWAPLFVGCSASHFLTDLAAKVSSSLGVPSTLSAYPCVALLCIMGSTHVVTFRAHIAIILILTLTIDAFDPENGGAGDLKVAGDYSAVFPLLTVAVFVALQISRQTVFYEKQRSRGDIMALPEVLCEPGKEGKPLVMDYDGNLHELDESDYEYETDSDEEPETKPGIYRTNNFHITPADIEANFQERNRGLPKTPETVASEKSYLSVKRLSNELPPRPMDGKSRRTPSPQAGELIKQSSPPPEEPSKRSPVKPAADTYSSKPPSPVEEKRTRKPDLRTLDDLLNGPIDPVTPSKRTHRRSHSEPFTGNDATDRRASSMLERKGDGQSVSAHRKSGSGVVLKRVSSFGQVDQEQPSLIDQARRRAASVATKERTPSKGKPKPSSPSGSGTVLPPRKYFQ